MNESINSSEIEANKKMAVLDSLSISDFKLESSFLPEQIIKKMEEILNYTETIKTNTILRRKLSDSLNSFIEKNWNVKETDISKIKNLEEIESSKKELNEKKFEKSPFTYTNNMILVFQRAYIEANPSLKKISKADFKDLNISEHDMAILSIFSYFQAVERVNGKKIYDINWEDKNNESTVKALEELRNKKIKSGICEVLKNVYDRLVLEKGYDPKELWR